MSALHGCVRSRLLRRIRGGDGAGGSGKIGPVELAPERLDVPTEGEIYYQEQPLSAMQNLDRFRASNIGFVFQSFHLLPTLTAVENVQIPMFEGPLSAKERREKARSLVEAVGMSGRATHLPTQLSVGERQRITIARALTSSPSDHPGRRADRQPRHAIPAAKCSTCCSILCENILATLRGRDHS